MIGIRHTRCTLPDGRKEQEEETTEMLARPGFIYGKGSFLYQHVCDKTSSGFIFHRKPSLPCSAAAWVLIDPSYTPLMYVVRMDDIIRVIL